MKQVDRLIQILGTKRGHSDFLVDLPSSRSVQRRDGSPAGLDSLSVAPQTS